MKLFNTCIFFCSYLLHYWWNCILVQCACWHFCEIIWVQKILLFHTKHERPSIALLSSPTRTCARNNSRIRRRSCPLRRAKRPQDLRSASRARRPTAAPRCCSKHWLRAGCARTERPTRVRPIARHCWDRAVCGETVTNAND